MFGSNKPFGTASTFGASSFGTTTTTFGQSTTAFGSKPASTNMFGTSAFGAAPSTSNLFGTNQPSTGLFGQPTTAFGQPASTSNASFGFGAPSTSTSLFGSATPSTQSSSLFGSSNTSAFGAPRPAFGGFGNTSATGTGLFGQSTTTGTSLFGGSGGFNAAPTSGTTVKFNPPTGTDTMMKGGVSTNISTRHQCITCMKEYENKSLEELRVEDYAANRKGPQQGAMGGFGAPTQQTGLFGAPATASTSGFSFGTTQSKSLFGTTGATNTFGGTGSSLFGQTQPAQQLFKNTGFGAPTTSAPAFNFGNTSGTSMFGQNTQQKSLFGQTTGQTGVFATPAPTQSTAFGASNTGFGAFGATNQANTGGGLFGAKPTGFGATNTTTTNTFSFGNANNMTGASLFGAKPAAPAFGATNAFGAPSTGFGFGATPAASTNIFNQPKPATSVFGNTGGGFGSTVGTGFGNSTFTMGGLGTGFGNLNANKAPGFSFSNPGTTGFGLGFGSTNPSTNFNFGPTASFNAGCDPNSILMQQQTQRQIIAMTMNPFGDSPLFKNEKDAARQEEVLKPTNPSAQKALLTNNHYKVSPIPAAKVKPKPLTPLPTGKVSLFDGLEDEEPSLGNATFVPKRSVKKLVLKHTSSSSSSFTLTSNLTASSHQPTHINFSISLQKNSESTDGNERLILATPLTVDITSPPNRSIDAASSNEISSSSDVSFGHPDQKQIQPAAIQSHKLNDTISALHTKTPPLISSRTITLSTNSNEKFEKTDTSLDETSLSQQDSPLSGKDRDVEKPVHPTGIVLKRPGYYTFPPLDEITMLMDSNGDCLVEGFTVGCEDIGKVTFLGTFNVAGLNLDEIVHFKKKEIVVYPDDNIKPPVGEGLNRKAEVTLYGVWPLDKTTHTFIKDPERLVKMGYIDRIRSSTTGLGATFLDYKPENGSWIFLVEHFSKYGLEDSDEEMEEPTETQTKPKLTAPPKKVVPKVNGMLHSSEHLEKFNGSLKATLTFPDEEEQMEGVTSDAYRDQNCTEGLGSDFFEDIYSPTLPLMARVDAGRIQGMKASFFCEDDIEENWSTSAQNDARTQKACFTWTNGSRFKSPISMQSATPEGPRSDATKRQRQLNSEIDYALANTISSPVSHAELGLQNSLSSLSISVVQSENLSSYPLVQNSALYQAVSHLSKKSPAVSNKIYLKPFSKSVLNGKQHLIADAGYFMGRSFRVGWGPGWQFVQMQSPEHASAPEKSSIKFLSGNKPHIHTSFCVSVKKLHTEATLRASNIVQKNLVQSLELQLEHSASTIEKGSPIFVPKPGTDSIHAMTNLLEHLFKDTDPLCPEIGFIKQSFHLWDLLVSLWGNVPDLGDGTDYENQIARREALSNWLITTTKERISNDINNNKNEHNDYLTSIFHLLNGRRVSDAVKLAQRSEDYRLSLLISQAEGNSVIRKLISKQLLNWEESGAYKFINESRLIIYCLLAGLLVWKNASETINCCENLDWKRALALHLWYHCLPNSSIQDAMNEFEKSFKGSGSYGKCCAPPYVAYIENMLRDLDEEMGEPNEENKFDAVYDTCYHLLKLYCDKSYTVDQLLMPETYTNDHLDYRLSWLLHLALSSIGYNIPKNASYKLHLSFAAQLESMNMWQWSIFVLLHITDEECRTKQVKDNLLKYVSLEQNDDNAEIETFLKEQLLIPDKWIFEAKAIKAHSMGKQAEEAWFLLKAGSYSKSHSIVVTHLASESIINEDYEYLQRYLVELALPERSSTILDWASGGQVYLDYITVSKTVKGVLTREMSAYDIEKILPEIISLCYRLSSIPAPTLKDRLSLSEMAKKTAILLRSIYTLQASRSNRPADLHTLALHMKQLPMPHDYVIEESRLLAHSYLKEVTTEI